MIRAIIRKLNAKREKEARLAAMIARRGMRLSNRKPALAAAYEATNGILMRGPKC